MDYMTLKEAAEKWGVTPRSANYYWRWWAYPWRCEYGWCLADPKGRGKAD